MQTCSCFESGLADDLHQRKLVERQILLYLQGHPAAADSAEGVRHWWLQDMGELSQTVVEEALGELLKRGWLVSRGSIFARNEQEGERSDG